MAISKITVRGARQHNLKNISVEIPRNTFTVITGLSGSGKSSLAFDTIYAEGQRRYDETLSPYARQTMDQILQQVMAIAPGERVMILAPIVRGRKGEYKKELEKLVKTGFVRARIDGVIRMLDEP